KVRVHLEKALEAPLEPPAKTSHVRSAEPELARSLEQMNLGIASRQGAHDSRGSVRRRVVQHQNLGTRQRQTDRLDETCDVVCLIESRHDDERGSWHAPP